MFYFLFFLQVRVAPAKYRDRSRRAKRPASSKPTSNRRRRCTRTTAEGAMLAVHPRTSQINKKIQRQIHRVPYPDFNHSHRIFPGFRIARGSWNFFRNARDPEAVSRRTLCSLPSRNPSSEKPSRVQPLGFFSQFSLGTGSWALFTWSLSYNALAALDAHNLPLFPVQSLFLFYYL